MSTQNKTIREIVIQQNEFLEQANIVLVFRIMLPDRQQVEDTLSDPFYFIELEYTRKTTREGKYMLVTIKYCIYCAQQEVDKLLGKYYNKKQTFENRTVTSETKKNVSYITTSLHIRLQYTRKYKPL